MRPPVRLLASCSLVLACASNVAARVIHVLPDGSGDVPTIGDALAIAVFGDSIALGDGVFYEHDLALASGVDIASDSGDPARTAIDAQHAGRCMNGPSVTGAPSVSGVRLTNGVHAVEGGLLLAGHNNIRFTDCVFENGSAPRGGAVAMTSPSAGHAPQFTRCRFGYNAAGEGGAIWSEGVGNLADCDFVGNTAQDNGGAIFTRKTSGSGIWLTSCRFSGNHAGGDGGAVYSMPGGDYMGTLISLCEFVGNSGRDGGAAWLCDLDFAASSRFLDNEASGAGGALHLTSIQVDEELDYYQWNLFARNRATSHGGAIALTGAGSDLHLDHSTLVLNQAPSGAHLWSDIAGPWGEIRRTLLVFGVVGASVAGTGTVNASCSDVYGNAGGDYVGALSGQSGINGNLRKDPVFCRHGDDDYTLAQGSPCYTPLPGGCGTGAIGAFGVGCASTSSVPVAEGRVPRAESITWGRLKGSQ